MKILIIDDDEGIRYTVGEIVSFMGWEAIKAENGAVGVEKFVREKPDIVLVDYHMPALDGLETVERIREIDRVVPIIVLTVDERQQIADKFLTAGASDFALKPIKAPDLIARLKVHARMLEIDRSSKKKEQDIFLAKGINKKTFDLIVEYLERQIEPQTIEEITEGVGLAYQTVHRYLLYMVNEGIVSIECDYGRIGRPKNKYKYLPRL
ncbi:response regulator [Carboxydothermus pertinax]|uniref:response regulator n=1 Tax=Carboxydothermus pertinax TaxID=870242 RepID=UPI00096ABC52|nr:response regulator [Carboxydothermus pertinax]